MNKVRGAASLAAGLAAGVTIALAGLPALADTLHPTLVGTTLVTFFVALVSVSVERGRDVLSRRRALRGALRRFPPARLVDAKLAELGVYPVTAGDDYQPPVGADRLTLALTEIKAEIDRRDADPCFARGEEVGWHVIVTGPPHSGKSRTAAKEAQTVLPDVPAIIPVDSDALCGLADGSVALDVPGATVCLWLDGLDRFVDALDSRGLRTLDELKEQVIIVATIRTEQWNEIVTGAGQRTDVARALAARARVITLGESADPAVDDVGEPSVPTPNPRSPLRRAWCAWRRRWRRSTRPARQWRWGHWERSALLDPPLIVMVAVIVTSGVAAVTLRSQLTDPPPLTSQMNTIRSQMIASEGRAGGHFIIDQQVWLHATEAPSWVIAIEPFDSRDDFEAEAQKWDPRQPSRKPVRSDELRIYDVVGGRLKLELDFEPHGNDATAAELMTMPGAPLADDYAGANGTQEIIAALARPERQEGAEIPIGIQWQSDRYQVLGLLNSPPALSSAGLSRDTITLRREDYEITYPFVNLFGPASPIAADRTRDPSRNRSVIGYPVAGFAFAAGSATRLLAGYSAGAHGSGYVLEVHAYQVRLIDALSLTPCVADSSCPAPASVQDVFVPAWMQPGNALLRAWSLIDVRWLPPITLPDSTARRPRSAPARPPRRGRRPVGGDPQPTEAGGTELSSGRRRLLDRPGFVP